MGKMKEKLSMLWWLCVMLLVACLAGMSSGCTTEAQAQAAPPGGDRISNFSFLPMPENPNPDPKRRGPWRRGPWRLLDAPSDIQDFDSEIAIFAPWEGPWPPWDRKKKKFRAQAEDAAASGMLIARPGPRVLWPKPWPWPVIWRRDGNHAR